LERGELELNERSLVMVEEYLTSFSNKMNYFFNWRKRRNKKRENEQYQLTKEDFMIIFMLERIQV